MAKMDRLDPNNAEDVKCNHTMLLSEDVSDEGSIDDRTESHEDYVEPREGDLESAEEATSDDDCCNEVYTAESCFTGKEKMKWGKAKSSTHI
jgi:hypothetical protein